MTFTWTSVVNAPVTEVFDWHAQPGAIARLMPPWQPVRIVEEASTLYDGRAVLSLPGGLRWIAEHDTAGYERPNQFVDRLATPFASTVLRWQHRHEFTSLGSDRTRVTDTVETHVPGIALREMFTYRHNQLADDLAARQRALHWPHEALTIAITGASGLIGSAVAALLTTTGHRVIRLVRGGPGSADERRWDPDDPDAGLLDGVDVVIHLAGASIAGRFTDDHKAAIRGTRIAPTRRLAACAGAAKDGPTAFICASAIGYYGADRGDEELTEGSERGEGFLADVVSDWELASEPAADAGLRCVRIRTGIVQSPRGGTLRLLYPLFAAGLGGRVGSGAQWQSWIGIDDLADIYLRSAFDPSMSGPINAVAPGPVRNTEYTEILARVLHRPALLPVPALGPRLLLGREGSEELALADQRVRPGVLERAGHHFRHPDLPAALRHVLGRERARPAP
ncbi:MAG: TIGR01777 family oxidoreductase [Mycobacteriales bacterium]